jgi:hypothetical protein
MTIREFCSTVRQDNNSISFDSRISNEYIYWTGINIAKLLIKRDSRKLLKNTAIFTKLSCVEMEEVSISECNFTVPCKFIMKSKKKLPEPFLSNFGSLIQVFNIDRSLDYKEVTPKMFKNISNQQFKPRKTKYFWLEDGYIYVPNSENEILIILGLFVNQEEVKDFNEGSSGCSSILDSEFPVPDYLIGSVQELTTAKVMNRNRINRDEDANNNLNQK